MSIPVTCSKCQKSEEVPDSFAGKRVCCQTCGNKIQIARSADAAMRATDDAEFNSLSYQSAPRDDSPISKNRRYAARACIAWGGFILVIAIVLGLLMAVFYDPRARIPTRTVTLATVGFVLASGSGLIYLMGGLRIRRGGLASAVVCLVLASIQSLFALLSFANTSLLVVKRGFQPQAFIALGVAALIVAAFGQIVYYLSRTLMEQYNAPTEESSGELKIVGPSSHLAH